MLLFFLFKLATMIANIFPLFKMCTALGGGIASGMILQPSLLSPESMQETAATDSTLHLAVTSSHQFRSFLEQCIDQNSQCRIIFLGRREEEKTM